MEAETWGKRLRPLTNAILTNADKPVLEVLKQEHPIGQLYARGEIPKRQFLAAMAYFAAVMNGPRIDELRVEIEQATGLKLDTAGRQRVRALALNSFSLTRYLEFGSWDQFDIEIRIRQASRVVISAIKNAKVPDSPSDDAAFRWALGLLPISLGMGQQP